MLKTLTMVMDECRNHFIKSSEFGKFTIAKGKINTKEPFLKGQYILIKGSILNDGCYLFDDVMDLKDEVFKGGVYGLVIPQDFIFLAKDIKTFIEDKNTAVDPLIKSENFGGYSYTLSTGVSGQVAIWKDVFGARLNMYRRMYNEEDILCLTH